jgi:rubredoxin-NAD+ reductase
MIRTRGTGNDVNRSIMVGDSMKVWMCQFCGWTYDEAKGDPASGLAPGTRWEDVPEDWCCPDCGATKSTFEMVEI